MNRHAAFDWLIVLAWLAIVAAGFVFGGAIELRPLDPLCVDDRLLTRTPCENRQISP